MGTNPVEAGDWFELFKQDFDFIGVEMNENLFKYTKRQNKVEIRKLIRKAASLYFTEIQATHQKTKDIHYEALKIQTYLVNKAFSTEERELIYILRSHCHKANSIRIH